MAAASGSRARVTGACSICARRRAPCRAARGVGVRTWPRSASRYARSERTPGAESAAGNVQLSAVPASLIAKYDVAGPRYTSYPTVPYWDRAPTEAQWLERVGGAMREAAGEPRGAALYIHVPFCRALCTYCGCNTRITRTHAIVMPYVNAVLTEYRLYRERLGIERPRLSEVHVGGGTPTFLDLQELEALLGGILGASEVLPDAALSVEVDPRVTTAEQLQLLARFG